MIYSTDPLKFFSSGGLGDAWIAFLKIMSFKQTPEFAGSKVVWNHMTGHDFHVDTIRQIVNLVPDLFEGNVHKITKSTMGQVEARVKDEHTLRLQSTAFDLHTPCPDFSWVLRSGLAGDIAVIQPAAGRDDKSFRHFTPYAVNTLIELFKEQGKKVVLLGYKYSAAVPEGVVNMTGKTTILHAISIIRDSSEFIGFDGFLAYVAMSMKVQSRVAFHAPGLSHHYSHPEWRKNSEFCLTSQKINEPFCLNWGQV